MHLLLLLILPLGLQLACCCGCVGEAAGGTCKDQIDEDGRRRLFIERVRSTAKCSAFVIQEDYVFIWFRTTLGQCRECEGQG